MYMQYNLQITNAIIQMQNVPLAPFQIQMLINKIQQKLEIQYQYIYA